MTDPKLQEAIDLLYECRDVLATIDTEPTNALYKRVWEWCRTNRNADEPSTPLERAFSEEPQATIVNDALRMTATELLQRQSPPEKGEAKAVEYPPSSS